MTESQMTDAAVVSIPLLQLSERGTIPVTMERLTSGRGEILHDHGLRWKGIEQT